MDKLAPSGAYLSVSGRRSVLSRSIIIFSSCTGPRRRLTSACRGATSTSTSQSDILMFSGERLMLKGASWWCRIMGRACVCSADRSSSLQLLAFYALPYSFSLL
jgi:hypothetical protein